MQKPPTLKSVLKIKIFVFKNKCKFKKKFVHWNLAFFGTEPIQWLIAKK